MSVSLKVVPPGLDHIRTGIGLAVYVAPRALHQTC